MLASRGPASLESIEPLRPQARVARDPVRDLVERAGREEVDPPVPLRAHDDDGGVPQGSQLVGDRGLADRELVHDDAPDLTGSELLIAEQLEDSAANRISQHLEEIHKTMI